MGDAGSPQIPNGLFQDVTSNGFSVPEPIAIVGMGMRLPGGIHTAEDFWQLLIEKRSTRCRVPSDRFNIDAFYSPSGKPGSVAFEYGHFLADTDDLQHLDTSFFSMSRTEVNKLDPQQRMVLEVVHECMENAGQSNWRGKDIGVYVGVWGEDWLDIHAKDQHDAGMYRIAGAHDFAISNRISYEYDLHGPSLTLKTACSSSLTGIHEAVLAIRSGSCSGAICAGTNLIISATMSIAMTEQGVMSPEGRCKTFDASANGYARGEAINAIYLKKLSDAIRDGDPVRAIIRHTAINCDGKTPGLSMPSSEAHEALMKTAYEEAHLSPYDTAFVELHGTGTPTGDPLEATAVSRCFGSERGVYIGSLKPNMGHSEGASGVSSVIKSIMALEHSIIPPNINFKTGNPKIPFAEGNMKVPIEPVPWPKSKAERVSINSFGIGGANAHVILESSASYGVAQRTPRGNGTLSNGLTNGILMDGSYANATGRSKPRLVVTSAENSQSLQSNISEIIKYAAKHTDRLEDISYTLCNRRQHFSNRAFTVVSGAAPPTFSPPVKSRRCPSIAFVFTGQGAQWGGMAKELMDDYPSFDRNIMALNDVLQNLPDAPSWDIKPELIKVGPMSFLGKATHAQPLVTAVQIALVNLLRSWGISPAAVVGHSSGEMAAAYAAGAITAEEAIVIAYYRGQVTKKVSRQGGMAAIGLGREDVAPFLLEGVVIACENSGSSVTLSGDQDALMLVCANIRGSFPDAFMRRLQVEMAYHSHHMQEVGEAYENLLASRVKSKSPLIPFFSSVKGKLLTNDGDFDAPYWRANLENPVLFHSAVKLLLDTQHGDQLFLEVGPHAALGGPLRQIMKSNARQNDAYSATLQRGLDCTSSVLQMAGELHLHGVPVKFTEISPGQKVLTDLPLYQWKHDESYWSESRVSRDWRLRKFPDHELLGARTLESTDLEPEWRIVLRVEEAPWLRDHKIIDDVVFPCAGYLCMAGEAIRQIASAEDFTFRNIVVKTALVLNDANSAEMVTTLRPVKLTNTLDSSWWDFSISSYSGNTWMKHCNGQIRSGQETPLPSRAIEKHPRTVGDPYTAMKRIGLNYGPAFQGLENCTALPNKKTASASLSPASESESHYIMHPTTIDHCLQIITLASSEGLTRCLEKLCVPTSIDYLYIGPYKKGHSMHTEATASVTSTGMIHGNVYGVSDGVANFSLSGGRFSPIESDASTNESDGIAGSRLVWKPHLDFTSLGGLVRPKSTSRSNQEDIEKLTLLSIAEIQRQIVSYAPKKEFLQKFKTWIDAQMSKAAEDKYVLVQNSSKEVEVDPSKQLAEIIELEGKLCGTECAPAAELISRIRSQCSDIVNETIEGIELLLPNDGLTHFYNALEARTDCKDFFASAGHLKPTLRVLEIGAGTGGTSDIVLKALTLEKHRMYSTYTYTDVSSGFFATAQERFKHNDGIEYKVLDISKDPITQGFEKGSYDLIVAANVLHATPSLNTTLTHVRSLLRPDGRLFLQELSPQVQSINLIMGILPGWWLGDGDGRSDQPYVSPERWDVELKKAGFSGVDAAIYDEEAPYHQNANIISRPIKEINRAPRVTFLTRHNESMPAVKILETKFQEQGYDIDYCTLLGGPPADQPIISLLELNSPLFEEISDIDFADFQNFTRNLGATGLLWITRSAQRDVTDPRFSMSLGLARSLRSELSIPFATLELDAVDHTALAAVSGVFESFHNRTENTEVDCDYEFVIEHGIVNIGRFSAVSVADELLVAPTDADATKLEIGKYGLLQTLQWTRYQAKKLSPDSVLVEPRCAGLNFKDVLVSMGIVDGSGLGLEGSGVIAEVGDDVKDLFSVGDRVLYLDQSCFTTRTAIAAKRCAKIPDSLTWEEAATMPCVYATVIHSLLDVGRLRKGQSVLIHSACGGIGLSAIQICQNVVNAEIYCTVGNDKKARYLMATFGIPRDHIFNSRDTSFLPAIKAVTNGRGVDLVLNSLSGELLHASWNCVAEYGKMVEIGKRDFIGKAKLNMDLFEYNRSFIGVDLARFDAEMIQPLLARVVDLATAGKIKPINPIKVFEGSRVEDAFRYMQKGSHIGKIVVTIPEDRKSLPVTLSTEPLRLSADASYLLVGGLGGLGRAVSTWMVENGARNLIYLSRSAGDSESDQAFFRELKSQGCTTTAIAGSVSLLADVEKCVAMAPVPIKGVLQMSMVLRDGPFLSMTHSDWNAAVGPKVQGTWNLHNALPKDLDFFVATSSISGTFGNHGQSNYAAANTFLDSFVQWRNSQGLAASVLDVGVMADIGYVSQNAGIQDALRSAGTYALHEQEFLDSMHWAIVKSYPRSGKQALGSSHVAIGIRSTKLLSDPSCRVNWKRDIRMGAYHNIGGSSSIANESSTDALKDFMSSLENNPEVLNMSQAVELVTREIGAKIYAFMMQPVEELDTSLTLAALGVDSLVTIEIRNWMKRVLGGVEFSTLEILGLGTIEALGLAVVKALKGKYAAKGTEEKDGGEGNKYLPMKAA